MFCRKHPASPREGTRREAVGVRSIPREGTRREAVGVRTFCLRRRAVFRQTGDYFMPMLAIWTSNFCFRFSTVSGVSRSGWRVRMEL